MTGPAGTPVAGRNWPAATTPPRIFFDGCHAETLEQLRSLPPERLQQKCCPLGGPSIAGWKWLRLLPEHEIHHRGQIYVYLAMLGIETPPIFGLTSEAVVGKRG